MEVVAQEEVVQERAALVVAALVVAAQEAVDLAYTTLAVILPQPFTLRAESFPEHQIYLRKNGAFEWLQRHIWRLL
jgi:hypothetical protein